MSLSAQKVMTGLVAFAVLLPGLAPEAEAGQGWPAWAVKSAPELEAVDEETHVYLLLDQRVTLKARDRELVERGVVKILDHEANDEFRVAAYDVGDFLQLRKHHAWVRCEGRVEYFARRETVRIRDSAAYEFDDSEQLTVVLPELRPGCLVAFETRHTLRSLPQLWLRVQRFVPVKEARTTIVAEGGASARVFLRNTEGVEEFDVEERKAWVLHDVPAIDWPSGRNAPAPALLGAIISFSERGREPRIRSWSDASVWAHSLYAGVEDDEEPLLASTLRELGALPESERVETALRRSREVRYFAMSIGWGGYRPRTPETTLERKMGDCKDKSFLAVTFLRRLGIEAFPVLIVEPSRRYLDDEIPYALGFNHVIVGIPWDGRPVQNHMTMVEDPDLGPIRLFDSTLAPDHVDDLHYVHHGAGVLPVVSSPGRPLLRVPRREAEKSRLASDWTLRTDEEGLVHASWVSEWTGSLAYVIKSGSSGAPMDAGEFRESFYRVLSSFCPDMRDLEIEGPERGSAGEIRYRSRLVCPRSMLRQGPIRSLTLPSLMVRILPSFKNDDVQEVHASMSGEIESVLRIEVSEEIGQIEALDISEENEVGMTRLECSQEGRLLTVRSGLRLSKTRIMREDEELLEKLREAVSRINGQRLTWIVAN